MAFVIWVRISYNFGMKTTVDIPSALYRRVKLRAAMQGLTIREFLIACLQRGLEEEVPVSQPGTGLPEPISAALDSVEPDPDVTFQFDKDGWPVLLRSADDRTVVTQELVDQIRDQGNA